MIRHPIYFLPIAIATLCWLATGSALSTRTMFLFNYASLANLPPIYEVIGGSLPVVSVLFALLLLQAGCIYIAKSSNSLDFQSLLISSAWLFLACSPLAILIIRAADAKSSGILPQTSGSLRTTTSRQAPSRVTRRRSSDQVIAVITSTPVWGD